jgi:hypothetical protein
VKERDFDRFFLKKEWDFNTIKKVKEWERKSWGGVNGKETLTKFAKCKSKECVRERLSFNRLEREIKGFWQTREKERF